MGNERSAAEVAEGVRAALAVYTQALDDGRTDDVVATFCADGSFEMPRQGRFVGQAALRQAYESWKPTRPQCHLVLNTVVTEWTDDEASATSDFVLVYRRDGKWSVEIVGRYHDVLHRQGEVWRFHSRVAKFNA
jgi:3-phenylpropionate/cinnamic acid dioxygenase small subunit